MLKKGSSALKAAYLLSVAQIRKPLRPLQWGMDIDPFDHLDLREWRRMRAWELDQLGWKQRPIATALGVTKGAVSRWIAKARGEGPAALLARPRPGHPAKLDPDQMRLIPDFLGHGAEAYGFRGEVWTCARVAKVIQEEFGVAYHKGHVSRLLKELSWTPQMPIARAIQRDEPEIEDWRVAVWPRFSWTNRGSTSCRAESGRTHPRVILRSSTSSRRAITSRSWGALRRPASSTSWCGRSRSTAFTPSS